MEKLIGIVDEANPRGAEDQLDIKKHANALSKFIKKCPTPLTIGVQGEWGSGKTSILNSIYHDLNEEGIYKQIWINSWENSLLSTPEEALLKIINEIIDEMIDSDPNNAKSKKIKETATTIFKGALRVGTSLLNDKVNAITEELLHTKGNSIKQLRDSLSSLSQEVMDRPTNPYKKIIVYVDDLDRIEPKEAVKILELLKNIFSINGCVFVLAIDYQVVVKGLEHKFGKRTEENEWEFRAFFDKIIQLPFMMPMGQYNIGKYVSSLLNQIDFNQNNGILESDIETIISYTIGGNPRAIKRLVNSLSLITIFLEDNVETEKIMKNQSKKTLLFSLVCLQIAYPNIYELLNFYPNFLTWDQNLAFSITKLKEEENIEKFNRDFENIKETDYFDEEWEQALFRICFIAPRYYKKVSEISKLFNFIKDNILKDSKEDLEMIISELISETSVTSVTSTDDNTSNVGKRKKISYAKPVKEYFQDIFNSLNNDDIFTRGELETMVKNKIKNDSGIEINPGTLMAQTRLHTINDKIRVNYGVNLENMDSVNLFYFVDESKTGKKDLMKKYLLDNPPKGSIIYYRDKKTKVDCEIIIK
ncbi:MAG: hypothetical protein IBX44_00025 [Sulfurospirillum sp.]|nr:hypothetical protein [Sulfurospirillum sp.]